MSEIEFSAGFMFFLAINTNRKIAKTEKTRDPTTGQGAVVSDVPSMTIKKAPNQNISKSDEKILISAAWLKVSLRIALPKSRARSRMQLL